MGELIVEILVYIVMEVLLRFLFKYPGAIILWLFRGRKVKLNQIVKDDWHTSFWISLLLWTILIGSIILLF
jgi:hypothetical protein